MTGDREDMYSNLEKDLIAQVGTYELHLTIFHCREFQLKLSGYPAPQDLSTVANSN